MTQIATQKQSAQSLKEYIDKNKSKLSEALPRHINPDSFMRKFYSCVHLNPVLLECTKESIFSFLLQSSQLGLEPGIIGHVYPVPFRNNKKGGVKEAQFIVGYKGLIALARRSGDISAINAYVTYDSDEFTASFGSDPKVHHLPKFLTNDPKAIIFAYAVARFKDGSLQFDVMSRAEIDAIRKRSRAGDDGPWVTDFAEMCKKTVLRRLCKMLPLSADVHTVIAREEAAESGLDTDFDVVETSPAPEVQTDPLTEMAAKEKKEKKSEPKGEPKADPNAVLELLRSLGAEGIDQQQVEARFKKPVTEFTENDQLMLAQMVGDIQYKSKKAKDLF